MKITFNQALVDNFSEYLSFGSEDEGEDDFGKNFDGDSEEDILAMMYPEGLDDNYIDDVLKEY